MSLITKTTVENREWFIQLMRTLKMVAEAILQGYGGTICMHVTFLTNPIQFYLFRGQTAQVITAYIHGKLALPIPRA